MIIFDGYQPSRKGGWKEGEGTEGRDGSRRRAGLFVGEVESGTYAAFVTCIAVYGLAARGGESLSPSPSLSPTPSQPQQWRSLILKIQPQQ